MVGIKKNIGMEYRNMDMDTYLTKLRKTGQK